MSSVEHLTDIHELQVARLETAIAYASTVTVEFGTGSYPLFAEASSEFSALDLYIGVNIDSKQHLRLSEKVAGINGFAIYSELVNGKINQLPVPDESVDVVFMGNVFGEPDSQYIMHSYKHPDGKYRGNSDIPAKLETLHEAKRILRPSGNLVILEHMTPYVGKGFSERNPYCQLVDDITALGWSVECAAGPRDEIWPLVSRQFNPTSEWSRHSYYVIAKHIREEN